MPSLQPEPMMDDHEIEAMRRLLSEREPRRVLEWGSGGSTLYWPDLFPAIQWVSIEHDADYFEAVSARCRPWVIVLHLALPEYIQLKDYHVGKFDFIINDGYPGARVRCFDTAKRLLADGGAVLLHDSFHGHYLQDRDNWNRVTEICPPNDKGIRGLMLFEQPKPKLQDKEA